MNQINNSIIQWRENNVYKPLVNLKLNFLFTIFIFFVVGKHFAPSNRAFECRNQTMFPIQEKFLPNHYQKIVLALHNIFLRNNRDFTYNYSSQYVLSKVNKIYVKYVNIFVQWYIGRQITELHCSMNGSRSVLNDWLIDSSWRTVYQLNCLVVTMSCPRFRSTDKVKRLISHVLYDAIRWRRVLSLSFLLVFIGSLSCSNGEEDCKQALLSCLFRNIFYKLFDS